MVPANRLLTRAAQFLGSVPPSRQPISLAPSCASINLYPRSKCRLIEPLVECPKTALGQQGGREKMRVDPAYPFAPKLPVFDQP
jgi:hypothetical protein